MRMFNWDRGTWKAVFWYTLLWVVLGIAILWRFSLLKESNPNLFH